MLYSNSREWQSEKYRSNWNYKHDLPFNRTLSKISSCTIFQIISQKLSLTHVYFMKFVDSVKIHVRSGNGGPAVQLSGEKNIFRTVGRTVETAGKAEIFFCLEIQEKILS